MCHSSTNIDICTLYYLHAWVDIQSNSIAIRVDGDRWDVGTFTLTFLYRDRCMQMKFCCCFAKPYHVSIIWWENMYLLRSAASSFCRSSVCFLSSKNEPIDKYATCGAYSMEVDTDVSLQPDTDTWIEHTALWASASAMHSNLRIRYKSGNCGRFNWWL